MLVGYLLLATVALCSVPALAQDSPLISGNSGTKVLLAPEFRTAPADKPDEPWRIIPKSDLKGVTPDGPLANDFTCLSIRSYVVKRDSKNSDSVHPAGYSTCVPTKRFSLKTADARETVSLTR